MEKLAFPVKRGIVHNDKRIGRKARQNARGKPSFKESAVSSAIIPRRHEDGFLHQRAEISSLQVD